MLSRVWLTAFAAVLGCLAVAWPNSANADLLKAIQPGVMCSSANALAQLTLPDGSSRSQRLGATPQDKAIAAAGDCAPIYPGVVIATVAVRHNTSVVMYDPHDEKGRRTFIVPNIDFVAIPLPTSPFTLGLQQHCPEKAALIFAADEVSIADIQPIFVSSLPQKVQSDVDSAIAKHCDAGFRCAANAALAELTRLGYADRYAAFLCARPDYP